MFFLTNNKFDFNSLFYEGIPNIGISDFKKLNDEQKIEKINNILNEFKHL